MNVIQRPRAREFCATMRDYIIDTDVTIMFAVKYGGKTILEEEYVPDANNQVRVRKLGQFCELALWGVWCAGETNWQTDAAGTFAFLINGMQDAESFVMFSRMQTKKDANAPGVLSEALEKVTYPGTKEYVNGFPLVDGNNYHLKITAYWDDNTEETKSVTVANSTGLAEMIYSFEASPDVVQSMFSKQGICRYKVAVAGSAMLFHVNHTRYSEMWCFRFKNVYDMPETLTATGGLKLAGNNESDAAAMYGVERKFGLKVTDEYTVNSGAILLQSDYKLWHNLLNAQEADVLVDGEWFPILITKQKFEREFRRSVLKAVEFSFRMADPDQNNMIGV